MPKRPRGGHRNGPPEIPRGSGGEKPPLPPEGEGRTPKDRKLGPIKDLTRNGGAIKSSLGKGHNFSIDPEAIKHAADIDSFINGISAKIMRADKNRGSKTPVIMITGNLGQRHKQYAESLGIDDYLNKPFRMSRLLDSISAQLAKTSK